MNTYRLRSEITAILARVEEGGELTPELLAEIDALSETAEEKVNNLFKVIRHSVVCEVALRGEAAYLTDRARRWATTQYKCREHVMGLLQTLKVTSLETELCRPTICKGPPVVKVDDGFNLSSLKGTRYQFLIEESIHLVGNKVKEVARNGDPLPEGISVVPGEPYLRL